METSPPPPPPIKPKLRIMCSYGGHIVPNPRTKSLSYINGETRILSIDPATAATLSSLTSHLAAALSLPTPLSFKYQLPGHDLLSLISLSSSDDLLAFLDSLRRLPRVRLFAFPSKRHHYSTAMRNPRTEAWFVDALESAKVVMQRNHGLVGYGGEGLSEYSSGGSGEFSAAAESIVLETASSFGSNTSSSASLSNSPPVKARDEDVVAAALVDSKVKVAAGESIAREHNVGVGNGISHLQRDAIINVASMENRISSNYVESDTKLSDPNFSGIPFHRKVQASGYHQMTSQLDQLQQQKLQYVQAGNHYIPQNPVGLLPVSSYYPMYRPQLHQQQQQVLQHFQYQPNQPYGPVYILPVAPVQPCNLPMHGTIAHGHPPLHPNTSCIPPQATHKEPIKVGVSPDFASRVYMPIHSEIPHYVGMPFNNVPNNENQQQPLGVSKMPHEPQSSCIGSPDVSPDFASRVYMPFHSEMPQYVGLPLNNVPYNENQQQPSGVSEMPQEPQSSGIGSRESPKYSNRPDDDPARDQIYKSQPSAPSVASKYQSMTKDTPVHLSEALTQLHIDNRKQQTGILDEQ